MKYAARLVLHLNRGSSGGTRVSELVDYPGVTVSDNWNAKKRENTRVICFKEETFESFEDAISAWKQEAECQTSVSP